MCAVTAPCDHIGGIAVEIGKSFQISLGVTGGDTGSVCGPLTQTSTATRDQLLWLTKARQRHHIGIFLCPFQPAFVSVDPQLQTVFITHRDLTGPEHSTCTTLHAEHDMGIIIDAAAINERLQISH